ncbi:DUF2800 domain-containing protein [Tissierella sp. MSJ-40]|uniref:DUF2800 domain-containing protein n=1 Tax=Tissierella simiarum TaxID=2841534 RepID=A0ABS6EAD2_9FIRM|nr:DUF2800 domain-containing protein [Tissierella simiarum]MBU5439892.1 DUF2800 domain-containing protein [Tissierella simiarum]
MREHAILSASGAHRWLECTPSARLEEKIVEETSIYAEEGTFMHELAELHLSLYLERMPKSQFNKKLQEMKQNEFYTEEIEKAIQSYVDIVIERINEVGKDSLILLEEQVNFSPWVPEGFGTSDVLIISGNTIEVIDLKGGRGVKVEAQDNPQMRLYALGAINGFGILYDIEKIRMTIIQPRLDNISIDETTAEELLEWGDMVVKPRAEMAFRGEGEYKASDHCRFCKVKAICRARAEENMKLVYLDFKLPPLLTDGEVAEVLLTIDELKKWATDVEDYAFKKAVNEGKKWTGFKLVEGRRSRIYSSEEEVAKKLLDAGYEEEKIFSKSLLNLTKLEKELGKKEFGEVLGSLIETPPGKLQLVPESDKRPEIKCSAELDFKN